MAIIPSSLPSYNGQTNAPDDGYPLGSARDDATPGDLTGTPRVAAEVNDSLGFRQALLAAAGITATGSPDKVGASQYLEAINVLIASELFAGNIPTLDGRTVQEYLDDLAAAGADAIIFVPFGQSNAARRPPRVSAGATPSNVFTFNGGSQKGDDSAGQINNGFAVSEDDMSSLVPYNENGEDAEGTAPGFAAGTVGIVAPRMYTWTGAIASYHWRQLKPGTAVWNAFCQGIRQLKKLAEADGYTSFKYVFYWDHGESEADNLAPGNTPTDVPVTKQQYVDLLENVNAAIGEYLGYITDQTTPDYTILMAPVQTPGTTESPSFTFREVQDAQLEYSLVTSNAFLVGGKSQMPSESDNVHTTGLGRRYLAEKAAQVYKRVAAGAIWSPLYMTSASRLGTVVTITCSVPLFGGLVIDTDTVSDTADFIPGSKYGFEYFDDAGKVSIDSITVNSNVMTVVLGSTPSGVGEKVRCAQIQPSTSTTASGFKPRTSIRSDTNALTSLLDGTVLYDFMVPHSIEVA